MNNIENYFIHEKLPESLAKENVQEVAEVIDEALLSFDKDIADVLIYPAIDMLGSELINTLAIQMHCDFYDDTLPLEVRRNLVKNSIAWHRIKGTPAAVEQMIQTVYQTGVVEEWFEYGGEPFFFKVNLGDSPITTQKIKNLIKMINVSKNVRSWLEMLRFSKSADLIKYLCCFADVHKKYEITPRVEQGDEISSSIFVSGHSSLHQGVDIRVQQITSADIDGKIRLGGSMTANGNVNLLHKLVSDSDTLANVYVGAHASNNQNVCISHRCDTGGNMLCSIRAGASEITYKAINIRKEGK